MRKSIVVLTIVVMALVFSGVKPATAQVSYNPNAEEYVLLSMNQAWIQLGTAAKDYIRAREQYEADGIITGQALEQALDKYRNAKVNYDMALMRVINNSGYVLIEKAVKRTGKDGKKLVDVTIKNEVGGSFEITKLKAFGVRETEMAGGEWDKQKESASKPEGVNIEEMKSYEEAIQATLPYLEEQGLAFNDVLKLMDLSNLFVSIVGRTDNGGDVMISSPYERRIPLLRRGERETVTFELLRDVENCTIKIQVGAGDFQKPVYLKQESTASGIEVQSQIPSVEAEMDNVATFNLNLQRFSTTSTTFALRVNNLPRQVIYNFIDPDNNNQQVTRVNFTEGNVRKNLQLSLNMPTRTSEFVQVNQAIPFTVLVMSDDEAKKFDALRNEHGRNIPMAELEKLNAGTVDLAVTPMGVGRLEVSASTFFYSILPTEEVKMTISVKNTGTGTLQNVRVRTDMPNNDWDYVIEPDNIRSLDPEQEEKVVLTFQPPEDSTIGKHTVTIKVDAVDRGRTLEATDKEVTVDIEAEPDIWGKLILIVLLIGIVLGIVIFGIKLSRR